MKEDKFFKPLEVVVQDNFELAFRRFKLLVQKENVLSQIKDRQSFEKPSIKKRRKIRESLARKARSRRQDAYNK